MNKTTKVSQAWLEKKLVRKLKTAKKVKIHDLCLEWFRGKQTIHIGYTLV